MAKILVVDDEPDILLITRTMLEKVGHEITEARSSVECFEKLKAEKPDLILMDVMMPDDDGWVTCRKLKEDKETKDIPVVIYTIRSSRNAVLQSEDCGADAHISKPFKKEELVETVERVLKG